MKKLITIIFISIIIVLSYTVVVNKHDYIYIRNRDKSIIFKINRDDTIDVYMGYIGFDLKNRELITQSAMAGVDLKNSDISDYIHYKYSIKNDEKLIIDESCKYVKKNYINEWDNLHFGDSAFHSDCTDVYFLFDGNTYITNNGFENIFQSYDENLNELFILLENISKYAENHGDKVKDNGAVSLK